MSDPVELGSNDVRLEGLEGARIAEMANYSK